MSGIHCILLGAMGANKIADIPTLNISYQAISGSAYAGFDISGTTGKIREIEGTATTSFVGSVVWLDGAPPAPEFSVMIEQISTGGTGSSINGNITLGTWYSMTGSTLLSGWIGTATTTGTYIANRQLRMNWALTGDTGNIIYQSIINISVDRSNL